MKTVIVIPTHSEKASTAPIGRVTSSRVIPKSGRGSPMLLRERFFTPEIRSFLTVGGAGFVVDVAAFNLFRSTPPTAALHPSIAKVLAVIVAMIVTYAGNRMFTWRGKSRHREIGLFALFNSVGLGLAVVTLTISHDLLGLTSRLSDNISANVVGLALGTAFRYWSYKRFVFAVDAVPEPELAPVPVHREQSSPSFSYGFPR
ncbi:MAG: GtrA family protein [Aeromicrobium sp.]